MWLLAELLADLSVSSCCLYVLLSTTIYAAINCVINYNGKNLPPGPWGLPIVGYYPFLSSLGHVDFARLSKKYGSVFSLRLGVNKVVVLNDYASISEAMNNLSLTSRPDNSLTSNLFNKDGQEGLLSWNGVLWREHRRFMLRTLRHLGLGKPEMEAKIIEEIVYMLGKIQENGDKVVKPVNYYGPSTSNVISSIVFGKRYNEGDPVRVTLDSYFGSNESSAKLMSFTGTFASFPFLFKWMLKLPSKAATEMFKIMGQVNEFFAQELSEHLSTYDERNIRDFTDAYIQECNLKQDGSTIAINRLGGIANDIFGAGSVTIKDVLGWLTLYLAKNPDIQETVYTEICNVIGKERQPCYADRVNMPYTQAVIYETLRHATLVPISVEHSATEEATIAGYTIPKGTTILLNLWAVHNDAEYWTNPQDFNPARFLKQDGVVVKDERLVVFSTGKRSCPGESFAYNALFLYTTFIIQKFKMAPPAGVELNYETKINFFESIPKEPLFVVFSERS